MTTFKTVLGTNKKVPKSRIWIEGKRLVDAGFTVGARYHRTCFENAIRLQLHPDGAYKVSGKGDKPIIDITGKVITDRFTGETVTVKYEEGVITIS
jgi:hypothetical protein